MRLTAGVRKPPGPRPLFQGATLSAAGLARIEVLAGGSAIADTIGLGGVLALSAGGIASGAAVNSGGSVVVASGGTTLATSLGAGGSLAGASGAVRKRFK